MGSLKPEFGIFHFIRVTRVSYMLLSSSLLVSVYRIMEVYIFLLMHCLVVYGSAVLVQVEKHPIMERNSL